MEYLIDTQTYIWFMENDTRLPSRIKALLEDNSLRIFLSIASLWEITIKVSIGKLELTRELPDVFADVERNNFDLLPIEPGDLLVLSALEFIHRDPFDRIIIAQAKNRDITLISSDGIFSGYPVKLVSI